MSVKRVSFNLLRSEGVKSSFLTLTRRLMTSETELFQSHEAEVLNQKLILVYVEFTSDFSAEINQMSAFQPSNQCFFNMDLSPLCSQVRTSHLFIGLNLYLTDKNPSLINFNVKLN